MKPHKIFQKVYEILVEHAEAPTADHWVEGFIEAFTNQTYTEWRFGGRLGTRGKFYRKGCRYYVLCAHEDRNPTRDHTIVKVNELLSKLPYYEPQV